MKYNPTSGWSRSECVTQSEVRTDLDDRMSCRSRLDGSSAALRLVMRPVVGPGLDLQLQLTLVKLAGQRPVERRWRRSPGGRDSKHSVIRSYASAATNIHLLLFGLKYVRKMWEMLIRSWFFSLPQKWITLISSYSCQLIDSLISSLQFEDKKHWMTRYPS